MIKALMPAAALLALAACNTEPTVVTANTASPDPMADELAKAPPKALPPAIRDNKSYRCADNSLAFVDFYAGDTQANLRLGERTAAPTVLTAPAAGEPYVAEGYSLTGSGATVTLATPGKPAQSCKG